MAKRDYYEILGVSKNVSKEELKKVYKHLAKKYHPDITKDKSTEEKFKEISEAYAVLSDDQKRAQYDQFGHDGFDQRFSQEDIFRNFDFDIFRDDGFNGFDSIFDIFFGGGRRRTKQRGADLRYDLPILLKKQLLVQKEKFSFQVMLSVLDVMVQEQRETALKHVVPVMVRDKLENHCELRLE